MRQETSKRSAARAAKLLPEPPAEDAPLSDWDDLWGWPPQELEEQPRGEVIPFKPIQAEPRSWFPDLPADDAPTAEHALAYARAGWPVFPAKHDKSPHTPNGFLDATTDPAQIEKWWDKWPGANIGFSPGEAELLVLDYDPGSSVEAARAAVEDLPETGLVASTPRGGEHHYYMLEKGDPPVASRTSTFTEHVDTRSFGGYVLLPPSSTKDGKYEWASRKKPARRSQALLDACAKAQEKSPDRDEWHIEPDLPENVELATKWLRGEVKIGISWCQPAIEGASGDHTTFATAAMMKSCGLSEVTALELMWEEWNDTCQPPWEYEDLAVKVANGYSYNTSPPGNVTPAYHVAKVAGRFEPVAPEADNSGPEPAADYPEPLSATELATGHFPRAEFAWQDFIFAQHVNLLYGDGGAGKTLLAEHIAVARHAPRPRRGICSVPT